MARRFDSYGILDCRCPLNTQHPLNRGLVANYAVPPLSGWRGANTVRDLVRGWQTPHDGTINGGVTWPGNSRPVGYGSLLFDGSTGSVTSTVSLPGLSGNTAKTVCCWCMPTAFSTTTNNLALGVGTTVSNNNSVLLGITVNGGSGTRKTPIVTTAGSANDLISSLGQASLNVWIHLCGTYNGAGTLALYVNGIPGGTKNITSTNTSSGVLVVGKYNAGSELFTGSVDDVRIYSRALSAAEVAALYLESAAGYPNAWNWLRRRAARLPVATLAWPYLDSEMAGGFCGMGMGAL